MDQPLLRHYLAFHGLSRNADTRSFESLSSREKSGARASGSVITELVNLSPTSVCRSASSAVADGERHAQAATQRELHGLWRERGGRLCWYGGEP